MVRLKRYSLPLCLVTSEILELDGSTHITPPMEIIAYSSRLEIWVDKSLRNI